MPAPGGQAGYQLLCCLARGGMGEVFVAEGPNPRGDPLVCVKRILPELAGLPEFVQMFVDEARLAAGLKHPNLVAVDDLHSEDGVLLLVMEYVRGQPVAVLIDKLARQSRPLPAGLAAAIAAPALRGLHFLHEARGGDGAPLGLVHRDVCPRNLLLGLDGTVKVIDFGLAKATAFAGSRTGRLKGTVPYLSPEQVRGQGIDRRTDVWAMGATLYELAAGRRLFEGDDEQVLSRIASGELPDLDRGAAVALPGELRQIVERACAFNSSRRYATAAEMADALEPVARSMLDVPPAQALAALAQSHFTPMPRSRDEADALGRGRWHVSGPDDPTLKLPGEVVPERAVLTGAGDPVRSFPAVRPGLPQWLWVAAGVLLAALVALAIAFAR
jgi:eukaryotic-like serine/threonine-protein kinase